MRALHASHGERVRIIVVKSWCIARRVLDGYIGPLGITQWLGACNSELIINNSRNYAHAV